MRQKPFTEHARLLRIMAHPTRLRILRDLTQGKKCVNAICEFLGVRQPNVSQHLAMLKRNGLVMSRKEGVLRCYRLKNPVLIESLFDLLDKEVQANTAASSRNASLHVDSETLVCSKHNVEVDRDDPRCLQPSSQCRFRELCPVMEAVRAAEKETK